LDVGLCLSLGFYRANDLDCCANFDDGRRFVIRSDEKLTTFLELERITHEIAVSAALGNDKDWSFRIG
jgi:hypothetical protein